MADTAAPIQFDVAAARADGVSDAQIAAFLAPKMNFDIGTAKKDGVSDSAIVDFLSPPKVEPVKAVPEPVSGTALGMAKAAGQTVLETVPKLEVGVGAMMKSAAQGEAVASRRDIDLMHRLDQGEEFGTLMKSAPNDLARLALAQYRRASPEEKATMRQDAINTVAAPPNALERGGANVLAAGQHGAEEAKRLIPLTPEEEGRTSVVVAKTAASLLTFLAAAGPAGVPGMVAYGGVESYGKTYEEAKKAGATDEDATVAAAISGVVQGGLNAVPAHKALAVADQIPKMFKGEFIKTLTEMAKSGGTLLGFTQVSQLADNYIAKETFEPARDLKQGLGENMGATFGVGALLPVVPAVAARAFRPRTPAEVAKPVLEAKTTDDAIAAAQNTVAEGTPVDISEITRNAEYGTTTEQNQARLMKLFGGMNEGTVEQAGEGYHYRTEADGQEQTIPLKVWDPAKPLAEGETTQATISPDLAAAQRKHYDSLGVKVVYFENDARIPFDGAVDPRQPDTIFLSNDPQRNAAQIGAHEVTHLLENTTLPDGTNLGDLLHDQVRAGMTPEGQAYAEKLFGGTAPKREAFGPGVEGDSAHADAVVKHLITELGADIGAEAPKFQTFAPRVVEAIEQRYGAEAAKGVLQKLIAGFKNALDTMRNFFSRADEHPEYGQTPTVSQHWVANLGEIHDTLAQMYAARFGDRVERENVALIEMRNKAQRERFLATGEAPHPGYVDPLAWALTLRRWHSELQEAGSDPSSVEKIKAAMVAERERLSKIGVLRDFADAARSTPAMVDFEGAVPTPAESPHTALLKQTEAAILGKVNGVEARLTGAQAERLAAVRSQIDALHNPTEPSADMVKVRQALEVEQQRMADAAAAPTLARGTISRETVPHAEETKVPKGAGRDLHGMPDRAEGNPPAVVPRVSSDLHARVAENPPHERGGQEERQRSEPREHLPEARASSAEAMSEVRSGEGREAPSGLQQATKRDVAVPPMPSGTARDGEARVDEPKFSPRQTETPEFREWFRSSKVVDAEGKPEIVYHGTDKDFHAFDPEKSIGGLIWFTNDRAQIESGESGAAGRSKIMEMYASIQNPAGWREYDKFGIAELQARGFDGVILPEKDGTFTGIAFEPTQVKSATGNSGAFDPANPDIRYSPKREEPFYSALTRGVEALKLDKATPGQWAATIANMPGVKAEERAWSGVEDWLKAQAKSVTKAEVLEHLRENEVQVSEIEKRAMPSADMQRNEIANRMYDTDYFQLASSQKRLVDEALDSQSVQGAKFSDFTLPGGENYRELLLTLPDKAGLPGAAAADNFRGVHWNEPNVLAHVRFNDRTVDGKRTLFLEEVQSDWHQRGRQNGYSWGDALSPEEGAQLKRLSEKREAGTSTPEEMQELRALHERQRAVEIGNKNRVPDAPFKTTWPELAMKRMLRYAAENGYEAIAWAPGAAHVERFSEALRKEVDHLEWEKTPEGIHLVGYKTFGPSTYHIEPGVARWLVLNERDQIVETHDGRADAEAAIKRLESAPDRENGGRQKVVDTTEKETVLSDAIGKALGQKIISDEGQKGTISGKDLRIDDTGMAGFYDRILPSTANKIGKKFGAKVEEKPFDTSEDGPLAKNPEEAIQQIAEGQGITPEQVVEEYGYTDRRDYMALANEGRSENTSAHVIPITPAMRESVMQGQPLFSPRITGENKTRIYTPEEQKAFENVGRTAEPFSLRQWINEAKDDLGRRILRGAVDRYIGIKESDPEGYMALRIANSTAAAVSAFKDLGTLKFDGHAYNIADRNGGVTNHLLRPLGDEAHDFIWWVAANRAERLKGEDRENLFGDTDIAALKKLNQGAVDYDYTLPNGQITRSREAVYLDSLRKLDVFNRNAMDLAVDAGLLPRDKVGALWSNPFYVPFYRQAAEGDASFVGPNTNSSFVKKSAFKTLTGGSEKLNNDLWENAFGNWQHMIDASLRNRAVTHVLDVASAPGTEAARKLTPQEANHLSDKEMKSKTVWIMKDGEKVNYLIEDPMLFKAVTVLDPLSDPAGLMTAGRWFKKVLQVGVTANPMFAVRNLIRDTEQTLAVAPSSANVVKNIYTGFKMDDLPGALQNIARAVAARDLKALDITDEAASAIAGGGLMRLNAGTESGVSNVKIRDVLNTPEAVDGFWNYVKTVAHSYREAVGQSEDVNRLALYKHLRDQGVPHDAASFAARDLADFTLSGASPVVRAISQLVPFMNARIQGLYKVGRAAADADANVMGAVGAKVAVGMTKRIAYVLGAATVLSVALDQIYKDDEEYQKLTDYDRSTYYNFRFGKTWYHIPKGFEIAALSNIATDGIEAFFDKKMTKDRFFRDVWQNVDSNLNMNPIPQAVRPVYDVQTNTSGLGRHIEPMGMEKLQPDERYTARSTMAARGLSTTVNAGLRAIPGINVNGPSPIQIDYMANAYGGWLATTSLGLADKVVRSFTSEPARPAGDFWADVTQGMVTTEPKAASRYTEMLYQQGKSIEQAYATYRDMISRGQAAEAAKFFEANKDELQKHGLVSGLMRLESNLNKQQRLIENNPTMSPEQKKLQIQALNAAKNRAAQQGLEAR